MAEVELRSKLGKPFADISSELYRVYEYGKVTLPDGSVRETFTTRIDEPQWLCIMPSGSHRILDRAEISHYIQPGWVRLYWLVRHDAPHFVV